MNLEPVCGSSHCITCSDEGEPMTVLEIDDARKLALCGAADGAHSTVETMLVDPVVRGELLLVHAGTAIARLAGEDAA